jgi:hypothetical protein
MWKHSLDKDSAIQKIKEKRKCVEINLGFMVQLNKWEELLKHSKEYKFYKFEKEGRISLFDQNDIENLKENEFNNFKYSIFLMQKKNKLYKVTTNESIAINDVEVNNFVRLLQTYENYPDTCHSLFIDTSLLNKNFFNIDIEEMIKSSY